MDRRDYLKPSRFGNAERRRQLDTQNLKERRSIKRTANFNLHRDIYDINQESNKNTIENVPPKKGKEMDRKAALQKFRSQREALKKTLQAKKKPPFIVGIPHHGSSPLMRGLRAENISKKETKATTTHEVRSKRVTRATTKTIQGNVLKEKPKINGQARNVHLFKTSPSVKAFPFLDNKTVFSFQPYKPPQSNKKLTSPHTPTVLKRSVQKKPFKNMSNLVTKLKRSTEPSKDYDEILAVPLNLEEVELTREQEEPVVEEAQQTTKQRKSPSGLEETGDKEIISNSEDNEFASQITSQHSKLQSETARLLELADKWQAVVLQESLPQEVVDEVDSVVGQTRLLTSDKFQQFRRLIVQCEEKTGTHPVTMDDLNGFWDMVYLQVELLDKKYTALDELKINNWVRPEPAIKKKRRPMKKTKISKETERERSPTAENKKREKSSQPVQDEQLQTPSTDMTSIHSVLLGRKRTRSNSPSPYIAMRLSGIGRTSSNLVNAPGTSDTPRNLVVSSVEAPGTPKSALKNNLRKMTESTRKLTSQLYKFTSFEFNIEETEQFTAATPRRSIRLMTKMQSTPIMCMACESAICDRTKCKTNSVLRSSSQKSKRSHKQALSPLESVETKTKPDDTKGSASKSFRRATRMFTFSPSESEENSDSVAVAELNQHKETDVNKPSTSRTRFSLRPSILTVIENQNLSEIPKKAKVRKQGSVCFASTNVDQDAEGPKVEAKSRRSTRQSRKVTFESGAEEKASFKLPATPFRRSQADC